MQITKGEFLDTIFDCLFEMHELVEDIDIAQSIHELKDVHKKVLYYSAIRQYSNQRIARIRNQTDRNMCIREKEFLENYSSVFADNRQTKPPESNATKRKQDKK